ncbi:MAG: hypothetical protein JWN30_2664, partial [Bacilli bacterium]|nr:hypothetical protein [Bacilli bacterium]
IPDEPAIAGKTAEIFNYYGISPENVQQIAHRLMQIQEMYE